MLSQLEGFVFAVLIVEAYPIAAWSVQRSKYVWRFVTMRISETTISETLMTIAMILVPRLKSTLCAKPRKRNRRECFCCCTHMRRIVCYAERYRANRDLSSCFRVNTLQLCHRQQSRGICTRAVGTLNAFSNSPAVRSSIDSSLVWLLGCYSYDRREIFGGRILRNQQKSLAPVRPRSASILTVSRNRIPSEPFYRNQRTHVVVRFDAGTMVWVSGWRLFFAAGRALALAAFDPARFLPNDRFGSTPGRCCSSTIPDAGTPRSEEWNPRPRFTIENIEIGTSINHCDLQQQMELSSSSRMAIEIVLTRAAAIW